MSGDGAVAGGIGRRRSCGPPICGVVALVVLGTPPSGCRCERDGARVSRDLPSAGPPSAFPRGAADPFSDPSVVELMQRSGMRADRGLSVRLFLPDGALPVRKPPPVGGPAQSSTVSALSALGSEDCAASPRWMEIAVRLEITDGLPRLLVIAWAGTVTATWFPADGGRPTGSPKSNCAVPRLRWDSLLAVQPGEPVWKGMRIPVVEPERPGWYALQLRLIEGSGYHGATRVLVSPAEPALPALRDLATRSQREPFRCADWAEAEPWPAPPSEVCTGFLVPMELALEYQRVTLWDPEPASHPQSKSESDAGSCTGGGRTTRPGTSWDRDWLVIYSNPVWIFVPGGQQNAR